MLFIINVIRRNHVFLNYSKEVIKKSHYEKSYKTIQSNTVGEIFESDLAVYPRLIVAKPVN